MKIVRETIDVPRDKYAWDTEILNILKTEDKPTGRIFFNEKKKT